MLTLDIVGYTPQEALTLILFGLQAREAVLKTKIVAIQAQLAGEAPTKAAPVPAAAKSAKSTQKPAPKATKTAPAKGGKRPMSAEARERIVAAQKKRWAKHRKAQKAAAKASAVPVKATPRAKLNLAPPEPLVDVEALGEVLAERAGAAAE